MLSVFLRGNFYMILFRVNIFQKNFEFTDPPVAASNNNAVQLSKQDQRRLL